MTTQEIKDIESVAKFMGLNVLGNNEVLPIGGSNYVHLSKLLYSTSWDALMPVVEKIENLGYATITTQNTGINWFHIKEKLSDKYVSIISRAGKTEIEATFAAVIAFIKWHNKQA